MSVRLFVLFVTVFVVIQGVTNHWLGGPGFGPGYGYGRGFGAGGIVVGGFGGYYRPPPPPPPPPLVYGPYPYPYWG